MSFNSTAVVGSGSTSNTSGRLTPIGRSSDAEIIGPLAADALVLQRNIVPNVADQHAEELAILWNTRRTLVSAGHVALRHLARFDERIAAHQDGCVVAGVYGSQKLKEQLADPGAAQVFAAAVVALDMEDRAAFDHCVAVVEAVPESFPGAASAVGWITSVRLKGVAKDLLNDKSPIRRRLGLAACRFHGADPGPVL